MVNYTSISANFRQNVTSFNLQAYLVSRREIVDRALERHIQSHQERSQTTWKAMRYALFPGGKRIRPILTLAAGELFGGAHKELLPFACAIEMIHTYSLVHDDLPALDNDDFRRGAPTTHKAFGEGLALLAGDGLLTEAFHLMSSPAAARSAAPKLVIELIHEVSRAAGTMGLVGGQVLDLQAENKTVDLATLEYIHVQKTGALIVAALRVGARIAGAAAADLRRITRYGEFLGLAFQISDDILDVEEDTGAVPSPDFGHPEKRKATYASVVGIVQAKERLRDLVQQAVKQLAPYRKRAEVLEALAAYVGARALYTENSTVKEMQA
jgi:geranylgeranyl diphosphate synthase type II